LLFQELFNKEGLFTQFVEESIDVDPFVAFQLFFELDGFTFAGCTIGSVTS
jgi:hypothetical protein